MDEFVAAGGQKTKRKVERLDGKNDKESKKAKKEARAASGQPKRPANAYWLWLGDNREALAKEAGEGSVAKVGKLAGERWNSLSEDAKKPWEAKAAELKQAYEKEMDEWRKSGAAAAANI